VSCVEIISLVAVCRLSCPVSRVGVLKLFL
jgi:hypothetical protein